MRIESASRLPPFALAASADNSKPQGQTKAARMKLTTHSTEAQIPNVYEFGTVHNNIERKAQTLVTVVIAIF